MGTKIDGPVSVIGDVHGQTEKLSSVLRQLASRSDYNERWIVFIGDLVDRGPDPKGSVELVRQTMLSHVKTTAIAGNHDFAMCAALGWLPTPPQSNWELRWLRDYNSGTTFQSYGCNPGNLQELNARIPVKHRQLLVELPWYVEHDTFFFVHAGLDSSMPFHEQRAILQRKDFNHNRPPWLCDRKFTTVAHCLPPDCQLTVVSGHERYDNVIFGDRRILIDTTGGVEGPLSCVLLPEREVISSSSEC